MKFKAILGAAVVLGTMMLASVTAHAATFTASRTSTPNSSGNYEINLTATGATADETLNGYIIKVKYDKDKVTVVQPSGDDFAAAGAFCSGSDSVFVADVFTDSSSHQTGEGVVAWAAASPKTIGTDAALATLHFEKADGFTTGSTDIEITLTQLSYNGTSANDTAGAEKGAITVGGTVIIYGDVDGNGAINSFDASLVMEEAITHTTLTEEQKVRADVDLNNTINSFDASLIMQKVLDKDNMTLPYVVS